MEELSELRSGQPADLVQSSVKHGPAYPTSCLCYGNSETKCFKRFSAASVCWRSNGSTRTHSCLSQCFWVGGWNVTSSSLLSGGWHGYVCQRVLRLMCLTLRSHRKGLGLTDLLALSSSCLSCFAEGRASAFISPACKQGRPDFGLSLDRLLSLSILNGDISLVLNVDSEVFWCCERGGGVVGPKPGSLGVHPVRVMASFFPGPELGGFKSTCSLWQLCCLDLPLLSCIFFSTLLPFSPSSFSSRTLGLSLLCCLVIIWILLWRRAPPMP